MGCGLDRAWLPGEGGVLGEICAPGRGCALGKGCGLGRGCDRGGGALDKGCVLGRGCDCGGALGKGWALGRARAGAFGAGSSTRPRSSTFGSSSLLMTCLFSAPEVLGASDPAP